MSVATDLTASKHSPALCCNSQSQSGISLCFLLFTVHYITVLPLGGSSAYSFTLQAVWIVRVCILYLVTLTGIELTMTGVVE